MTAGGSQQWTGACTIDVPLHGFPMASSFMPSLTSQNRMAWFNAHYHWTLEQIVLHYLAVWDRYLHDAIVPGLFGGGGIMLWGCWTPPSSSKGLGGVQLTTISCTIFILPTLHEHFGEGPFLFQHKCATVYELKVHIKTMLDDFGCGRTWLACTVPWPQPHRTPLGWTRIEIASQAVSFNIHVCNHKRSLGDFLQSHPKTLQKAFWEEWKLLVLQNVSYIFM